MANVNEVIALPQRQLASALNVEVKWRPSWWARLPPEHRLLRDEGIFGRRKRLEKVMMRVENVGVWARHGIKRGKKREKRGVGNHSQRGEKT